MGNFIEMGTSSHHNSVYRGYIRYYKYRSSLVHVYRSVTTMCTWGIHTHKILRMLLFGWLVVLRPKSTAMAMAGQSVHLTTLFAGPA